MLKYYLQIIKCFSIIFLLICILPIQSRFTVQKLFQFKKLLQCRALGYDPGIRNALVDILLGKDDISRIEQCTFGCHVGWFFALDWLTEFEVGMDPAQKFTIGPPNKIYEFAKDCAHGNNYFKDKCAMGKDLPVCVYNGYSNYVIRSYFPWWPQVKSAIDTIVEVVPFLRRIRNTIRNVVVAIFVDHVIRRWIDATETKIRRSLARGVLFTVLVALIKRVIHRIRSVVIPIPLPRIIKDLIPPLRSGLAIQLGGFATIIGSLIIKQIERIKKLYQLILVGVNQI